MNPFFNQTFIKRRLLPVAAAAIAFDIGLSIALHARADEVMPTVTVIGDAPRPNMPSAGEMLLKSSMVPVGARPIYGGKIDEFGGQGTIVGYRIPTPAISNSAKGALIGTTGAVAGALVGGVPGAVVGATVGGAGGLIAGQPSIGTPGTVVMLPPGQVIAPGSKLGGKNGN